MHLEIQKGGVINSNKNTSKLISLQLELNLRAPDLLVSYGSGERGLEMEILQGCLQNPRKKFTKRLVSANLGWLPPC